jgi:hypothetical protein
MGLSRRIGQVSSEIEAISKGDEACRRLTTVPGIGPIVSSAFVAAIGAGEGFARGRDRPQLLPLVMLRPPWRAVAEVSRRQPLNRSVTPNALR